MLSFYYYKLDWILADVAKISHIWSSMRTWISEAYICHLIQRMEVCGLLRLAVGAMILFHISGLVFLVLFGPRFWRFALLKILDYNNFVTASKCSGKGQNIGYYSYLKWILFMLVRARHHNMVIFIFIWSIFPDIKNWTSSYASFWCGFELVRVFYVTFMTFNKYIGTMC